MAFVGMDPDVVREARQRREHLPGTVAKVAADFSWECPKCGAPVGSPCIVVGGRLISTVHRSRRLLHDITF